jgi:hypothetical protein
MSATGAVSQQNAFIALILVMLIGLGFLSRAAGGATFNPCDLASAWATGQCTARRAVLRSAAQAAGAVGGAYAALHLLPAAVAQHGPVLVAAVQMGVPVEVAAGCEFVLALLCTLVAMASADMQPGVLRSSLPLAATAVALRAGSRFSGPVLNPVAALSWSAVHWPTHQGYAAQHLAAFWVAPLAASVVAAWAHAGMRAGRVPAAARRKAD